jgi:hypothetical protein
MAQARRLPGTGQRLDHGGQGPGPRVGVGVGDGAGELLGGLGLAGTGQRLGHGGQGPGLRVGVGDGAGGLLGGRCQIRVLSARPKARAAFSCSDSPGELPNRTAVVVMFRLFPGRIYARFFGELRPSSPE